jgi:hypothetical protein
MTESFPSKVSLTSSGQNLNRQGPNGTPPPDANRFQTGTPPQTQTYPKGTSYLSRKGQKKPVNKHSEIQKYPSHKLTKRVQKLLNLPDKKRPNSHTKNSSEKVKKTLHHPAAPPQRAVPKPIATQGQADVNNRSWHDTRDDRVTQKGEHFDDKDLQHRPTKWLRSYRRRRTGKQVKQHKNKPLEFGITFPIPSFPLVFLGLLLHNFTSQTTNLG